MVGQLTAAEVVQVAVALEERGLELYRSLSNACDSPDVAQLCRRLAIEERKHLDTYRRLQRQVAADQGHRLISEEHLAELEQLVTANVLPDPSEVRRVAMKGSLPDAIRMALEMEQHAVRFFSRMIEALPSAAATVQTVLQEEQHHLADLQAALNRRPAD